MKRLLTLFALLALTASSAAAVQDESGSFIGMFTSETGTACDLDLPVGSATNVYILASLNADGIPSLTACEFSVLNYPGNPGYPTAIVTPSWTTTLVIGSLAGGGISLAYETAQEAQIVLLGQIEFLVFDPTWIVGEYVMEIAPAAGQTYVNIVDAAYTTWWVNGGTFTFNCEEDCPCEPGVASQDASWTSIKALY